MAAIPERSASGTVAAIYAQYERTARGGHRDHLGASLIGHPCERHLWMTFRWVGQERHDGRLLRLFKAGNDFEPRIVAELRSIGVEVHDVDDTGEQWRVSAVGGHFGGSMDGAARGLPEAPSQWHVLEFKTHSEKSWQEVSVKGVREAKPQHYDQMQTYMGLTEMPAAMYIAENKNTSAVYAERVKFDAARFAQIMERAERVINAAEPPLKISNDPAWYECKFCRFHAHCHGDARPEPNCRTCSHSTPVTDGEGGVWRCELQQVNLDPLTQRDGCEGHRVIQVLLSNIALPVKYTDEGDGNASVTYQLVNADATFTNGRAPGFTSREIHAAGSVAVLVDPTVNEAKATWKTARVVG